MRPQRTTRICNGCGASFLAKPSIVARGQAHYCGIECRNAFGRRGPRLGSAADRLWARVEKSEHGCWTVLGADEAFDYGGTFNHFGRKRLAHQLAWELATGAPVPEGMAICHICDTPGCVRNDERGTYRVDGVEHERWGHLFCAHQSVNLSDMHQKGRANPLRGERTPSAKLTEAMVREIRALLDAGLSHREAAGRLEASKSQVTDIAAGRTWQHVK